MKKRDFNDWTKEELIKEVNVLRKQKTYGLVWEEDKTKEDFDYYLNWEGEKNKESFGEEEGKFPVLKEVEGKSIDNEDPKYNLMIEGDNYHSLAVMNFTHNKAIDVIYIDPPYNTGNKDFIYFDSFSKKPREVASDDPYKHSKWLSFMSKRLKLARGLLKNTGIIFISIDDNECAQLKLLCDNIFGEQNFLAKINRIVSKGSKNDSRYFVNDNDYILVYAKLKDKCVINPVSVDVDISKFTRKDKKGNFKPRGLEMGGSGQDTLEHRPKMGYSIYYNEKTKDVKTLFDYDLKKDPVYLEPNKDLVKKGYICIRPRMNKGKLGRWRWGAQTFIERFDDIFIDIKKKRVYTKDREKSEAIIAPNCNLEILNTEGTKELTEIFGKKVFDFPKPSRLIKYLIDRHPNKKAIVLDFFAGTGTTGQSVMSLNKEDGGKRKFILCTNNENNNGSSLKIATDICYPRIRKLIEGYTKGNGKKVEGFKDNFKYFKTDFVDSAPTDQNKKKIVNKSTEMLCIKENAFRLIKEKEGYKIFKNTDIHLGIIFDEDEIDNFIKDAKLIKGRFNVYIFSLDDGIPEREFRGMKGKVKLCPIPEAILHVYRRIFK